MALRMRHRVALLLAASFGLSLVYTSNALATTRWVDDFNAPNPPAGTSCADPGFNDIQSAVLAANPGDTIRVCPGVYTGGVSINKRLIVRGAKFGQDARTRGTANESIINGSGLATYGVKLEADQVTLDGFTVRNVTNGAGIETSPAFSGHIVANNIVQSNVFGIYANSGSAFQNTIRTNLIRSNNRSGSAAGNGIYADQGTQRMLITRNAIRNETNGGILLTGDCLTTNVLTNHNVTIQFNSSLNNSSFVALFCNNSNIQIRQNQTNDTVPGDNGNQGSAIFVSDNANGVVIASNVIRNSPFSGVAVRGNFDTVQAPDNVSVNFNQILHPGANGVDVTNPTVGGNSVFRNTVRNAGNDGIYFGPDTSENLINTNNAKFSGNFDCHDESTDGGSQGTANTWTNNIGPVSDPPGICRRS
jgi:hypothetical protein